MSAGLVAQYLQFREVISNSTPGDPARSCDLGSTVFQLYKLLHEALLWRTVYAAVRSISSLLCIFSHLPRLLVKILFISTPYENLK
jgi:hypothetical protein